MTAADKLRQELRESAPVDKKEFIDHIASCIRGMGKACFICDSHIGETSVKNGTIRPCHEEVATEIARSEGFRVSYDHNSYGVRYLVFTL